MEDGSQQSKNIFESSLHETLDSFYQELYKLSEKSDKILPTSENNAKEIKDKAKENVKSSFQKLVPSTQDFLKFDKHTIYDFDIWEMDGQCMIASIVENSYYLHCLDTQTGKMDVIKQEKIELTLAVEKDSFYIIKFAEYYPDEEKALIMKDDIELILVFAGKSGLVFIVHIEQDFRLRYLLGNVNEVYDVCVPNTRKEPLWRNLLFSCSKDTSVYLWNMRTGVQIACFREMTQVPADSISIGCHYSVKRFAVSHFDGSIKVWHIEDKVIEKIKEAQAWKKDPLLFKHIDLRKPFCITRDLHYNTCDYVQFYGDFIVSKDSEGTIVVSSLSKLGAQIIYEVEYDVWEPIWFVKFGLDPIRKLLYVGNDNGEVFFWKMGAESIQELAKMELSVKKQVRKAMLTSDCKYIILTTDDGKLWYLQLDKIPTC